MQPETTPRPDALNIASYLPEAARVAPDQPAIIMARPHGAPNGAECESISFAQLESCTNRDASALSNAGIERGMRVLLMVRPGIDFISLTFALFKMGAAPVLIDPGMGVGRMLDCIRQVDVHAFVGVPKAHVMRVLRPGPFRSVEHWVTVGRRWGWGGESLQSLARNASESFTPAETRRSETAAILFTSGSTGPAKGVVYEHGMFDAQVRMIRDRYAIQPGEVDLAGFPLFALFNTAMQVTTVIPVMDASRPARVNPANIVSAIHTHHATSTFGSPAIWTRVAPYCVVRGIRLPTLRRILVAGAPVPFPIIEQLHRVLPDDADVHTPYGATEALPVATICGRELSGSLSERTRAGRGTCVGRPWPGVDVRLIRVTDEPIADWSEDLCVSDGKYGELVVAGEVVTKDYYALPNATALAKIRDGDRTWHRMGDVGYRDEAGRLWFCGRKSQRVVTPHETLYADQCEAVFNEHPSVFRSALVGVGPVGKRTPILVVEPITDKHPRRRAAKEAFSRELLGIGQASEQTRSIKQFEFRRRLPVDVRHNAKIDRERIASSIR